VTASFTQYLITRIYQQADTLVKTADLARTDAAAGLTGAEGVAAK
jgi:hypothetical protein